MSSPIPSNTADLPQNGRTRATLLSSNSTLFWRVFVPVFFTVFLTGLVLVFWLTSADELYMAAPIWWVRIGLLVLWAAWLLILRRTLWRLKRVDADDTHLYVTNYWTTVRYPWTDVEAMEEKVRLGRRIVNLRLKAPGRFGSILSFLPGTRYRQWMQENQPDLVPAALVAERGES